MRRQEDAHEAAQRPKDETVDQVDGEDVREHVLEEAERETFPEQRGKLDDELKGEAEYKAVQYGNVVGRVAGCAGLA